MTNEKHDPPPLKDNERYWKERHKSRRGKLSVVGDTRRSEDENISLYAIKRKRVFDIVRALGLAERMSGLRVLDAGCGTGMLSELFFILGADVTGVDVSKVALKEAALRCPGGDFRVATLADFKIDGPGFDLAICADVLYHIVDDDNWAAAVRSLAFRIVPGGVLVIIDQLKSEPQRPATHVRFRTHAMYDATLRTCRAAEVTLREPDDAIVYRIASS